MRTALVVLRAAFLLPILAAQAPQPFRLEETTIRQIHAAFRDRSLTCRSRVEQYLRRIEAHDKQGAKLNAIVMTNPDALKIADDLDRRYRLSRQVGAMHCIPVLVKDNDETIDMPTTAGSLSLKGMMTGKDAFVVKRLREAGAVMLAKSNMAEFAFSPVETVNSILSGYTRNPYDKTRVTAGSSGGSAAALAANFAAIALASDTGDSIRGPAAHQALVGLRSTMGLVSRSGVVPLNLAADIAGAVTRTVEDTAAVLQVIAGEDPDDPVTAASRGHVQPNYAASLRRDGLKGARLGVLHQAYDTPTLDREVDDVFKRAIGELRNLGAEVIDPVEVEGLDALRQTQGGGCSQFQVRPESVSRRPRRQGADAITRRDHQVAAVSPVDSGSPRVCAGVERRPRGERRMPKPGRVPREAADGGLPPSRSRWASRVATRCRPACSSSAVPGTKRRSSGSRMRMSRRRIIDGRRACG